MVVMNAFTGHMKATMMVRPEPERIDSMKQLAQRQGIKTFVWQGSAYESLLKNSRDVPEYQGVWEMVARSNGTMGTESLYSEANLVDVQQGKAVIVSDMNTMRYRVSHACRLLPHGTFYFAREQFFPHKFAMALNKKVEPTFVSLMNQR
ncbi:hypothetical protein HPB48_010026 [Haemaphysalis longicornis]|uniref:Uncharacterized protein n=1 Tax=Haemaphysalis longicornis TaxID=44386 RepID=A0A9J6GD97_HAELO|nr:hypothetical protein HPB48_010026 [Haemaphysalis longicornis]